MENQYDSIGRIIQPGFRIPVSVIDAYDGAIAFGADRLVLVIVSSGSMIVDMSGRRLSVTAPGCLCINETEKPSIVTDDECVVTQVLFHPSVINSVLTFQNIRTGKETLSLTEGQDSDFLKPFIVRTEQFSGYMQFGPATGERVLSLINNLKTEIENQPDKFWPCRSRSYFLELIFMLFKRYGSPEDNPSTELDGSSAERIIHYINSNYDSPITIEGLCRRFHTNHTTLSRMVRESSGMTVNKLINQTRINAACVLLRDTNLPVIEIVYRSGFGDISHFGRMFRRITGHSPGEYRNLFGNSPTSSRCVY
ncbi:MAG TPA: AraC family transcriptional regulator [Spirochaetota bacterium]